MHIHQAALLKRSRIRLFTSGSRTGDNRNESANQKIPSRSCEPGQIWIAPLHSFGRNTSSAAFQLCVGRNNSETWSIRYRYDVGTALSQPTFNIDFTNHGDFVPNLAGSGPEETLPSEKPIPCRLASRMSDVGEKDIAWPYEALFQRSKPFRDRVCTQFNDQRGRDFLRHIVNEMCQDVYDRFMLGCSQWERSEDAVVCRVADRQTKAYRPRTKR